MAAVFPAADSLLGGSQADYLVGGGGDDGLKGGAGTDTFNGGDGYNTIYFDPAHSAINVSFTDAWSGTINSGDGTEYFTGVFSVHGTDGSDTFTNANSSKYVQFAGGKGSDAYNGNANSQDEIYFASEGVGAGRGINIDLNNVIGQTNDTYGNPEDYEYIDRVAGSDNPDTLIGGDGNNRLRGEGGGDTIKGGAGDDTLEGGGDSDFIDGGAGNDIIQADAGDYSLYGADITTGTAGDDTIDGGAGVDTIYYNGAFSDYTVLGDVHGATITGDGFDELVNVEFAQFSDRLVNLTDSPGGNSTPPSGQPTDGNDVINGGTSTDPITGGAGADDISSTPAAGTTAHVYGGSQFSDPTDGGDHIVLSGQGAAEVFGNGGDDVIDYTALGAGSIYGGAGGDHVSVTNNADNEIVGGKGGDTIAVTGDGDNTVFGGNFVNDPDDEADTVTITGNGHNTVYTNGGDDVVAISGSGENTIYTGMGNYTVLGGSGDDTFIGGKGANVYTGGDGADTFVNTRGGSDIITDFHADQGDKLDLQGQVYFLTTASDGSAALILDGGGVIILQGVSEAEFTGDFLV